MNDHEYVHLANSDAFYNEFREWLDSKTFLNAGGPLERNPVLARAFFETLSKKSQRPASEWQDYLIDEYLFMMGG